MKQDMSDWMKEYAAKQDKHNQTIDEATKIILAAIKGLVLIVDFIKSGLCSDLWEKELPKIDVGDTILYEGVTYTIRTIDVSRNTFNSGLMTKVGLLVV